MGATYLTDIPTGVVPIDDKPCRYLQTSKLFLSFLFVFYDDELRLRSVGVPCITFRVLNTSL